MALGLALHGVFRFGRWKGTGEFLAVLGSNLVSFVQARGPKKHLKRMFAPSHWCLDKLRGLYATRPSTGPHKLRECIPLSVLLRNRLKYALSGQECLKICRDKDANIKIDNRTRRDPRFPLGFQDVVSIVKTGENFRILYDTKGRFQPHRIESKEASFKLLKVTKKELGKNKIPYIVTHDGRTIRFPHPDIKKNDTIKVSRTARCRQSLFSFPKNELYI